MRRTVVAALAFISLPAILYAQADSLVLQEFSDLKIDNCGLNAAVFLLDWFDVPIDLSDLQNELQVGLNWERSTSMLSLKESLEANGLRVSAYKEATLDDTLTGLDGKHVCLLHVGTGEDPKAGHFYVVPAAANGSVLVVDVARHYEWVQTAEFRSQFAKSFSGFYLSVSRENQAAPRTYTLNEPMIEIDLGDIPSGQGILKVQISVGNRKTVPLIVESVKGSCDCFKGAVFKGATPQKLEPTELQVLELSFERSKLGVGSVVRDVHLYVRDTETRDVVIRVKAHVLQTPPEKQISWLPERIDFGLIRDPSLLQKPQILTIMVPRGVSIQEVKPDSSNVVVKAVSTQESGADSGRDNRQVYRFEVTLPAVRPGPLREKILVTTTDTNYPRIEIPLVGEVVQQ